MAGTTTTHFSARSGRTENTPPLIYADCTDDGVTTLIRSGLLVKLRQVELSENRVSPEMSARVQTGGGSYSPTAAKASGNELTRRWIPDLLQQFRCTFGQQHRGEFLTERERCVRESGVRRDHAALTVGRQHRAPNRQYAVNHH